MLRVYIASSDEGYNKLDDKSRSIVIQDNELRQVALDCITSIIDGAPIVSEVGDYWSENYFSSFKELYEVDVYQL